MITSCYSLLSTISFFGLGHLATEDMFKWVTSQPKLVKVSSLICRAMDDIVSNEFEQERGHVASGVECCMKQYGISEEEAYKILDEDIKNYWKDINEECLNNPHDVPKSALGFVLNFAQGIEVVYENQEDRFTNGKSLKHYVVQLLLNPIPIEP
ncbi:alpha-copaene synthase-like [Neltuma alba]|uniref:alpha-copaene synthase-like n=1 Tax=Neltuma alba TaxID=207710 RepID=UPI0010A31013|nr:alpha-copaene synthase-like [Prosopis alba]